jgi:hypothetical protein
MAILNVFKLGFKVDNGCGLMEEGWGLQVRRTRRPGRSNARLAAVVAVLRWWEEVR